LGVPFFSAAAVRATVPYDVAYAAVREAFIAHARGEWTMQPKLYVTNYPAGDFRAMPALGGGHALLKWVTSFPGNPALGLPTVSGLVVLSDAETGMVEAVLEAGAVTALRTGAAAVLAAETLRPGFRVAAVIGAGVNGRAVIEQLGSRYDVRVFDRDRNRAESAVEELGGSGWVAPSIEVALACEVVVTVTPGQEIVLAEGSLTPGQHVSLMGADGPGKAEIAVAELARARVFCDDWVQASHGGELAAAVAADVIARSDVTELGAVLTGEARGRRSEDEITIFDSTGLAIQDLAIAVAAHRRAGELELPQLDL